MSGSSDPPAELLQTGDGQPVGRRRALVTLGHGLVATLLIPAFRLHAESAAPVAGIVKSAFGAGSLAEVLRLLGASPTLSDQISLDVPDFFENGAMVPVEITSRLPGAQEIYIISESNPFPLVARFSMLDRTEAFVSTRIKVASSCNIHALVQYQGRFLSAVKPTTVAVGGCGA